MAEVKLNGLWKVTMREYERGWGQRDMGTKFFDTEQEAKEFCEQWSDFSNPDCYFRADYSRVA
jgi:hypothetical protein